MAQLTTKLVATDQDYLALELPWNTLHRSAQGTIFQTFSWLRRWWEIYADKNMQLRIVTVWNADHLVGVLPLFLELNNFFFFTFKRLRFMGTYEVYGEYTPLIHPEYEKGAVESMAAFCEEEILQKKCDLITFFRFPSASTTMASMLQSFGAHRYHMKYNPDSVVRVTMNLPGDWSAYLNTLSPMEKELLKRRSKSLEKHGARVEVITQPNDNDFDDFVRLHTAAWVDKGISGYFGSKRFEEFQRTITKEFMQNGKSRIYFLEKGGIRFAAVQAFFMNKQCCFYLSGLDRHHELLRYSPGKILLSYVIKDAINEHFEMFDFQGGTEEYKFRLGGTKTGFAKSVIWNKGLSSIKVFAVLSLQGIVNVLIGGIWAYHVLPRWHKLISRIQTTKHSNAALASSLLFLPE